jgi:hypothetical protein
MSAFFGGVIVYEAFMEMIEGRELCFHAEGRALGYKKALRCVFCGRLLPSILARKSRGERSLCSTPRFVQRLIRR